MLGQTTQPRADPTVHVKRSILYVNNNLSYIQLGQLQKNIADLLMRNKKKYSKIAEARPDFSYQLYKTGEFQANSRPFGKQLLLRQLDRLLQQKNYLDRELSLIRFESEAQSEQKQKMMSDEANHFELLKSIWKRDRQSQYEGAVEHAEELNLMVGQIKSNIQSLIKFQANEHKDFQQVYLDTFRVLNDRNRECARCLENRTKSEILAAKLEAAEERVAKVSDQNISFLEEISKRDDKLRRAAKLQLKQETDLKDRLIRLEQDLHTRDQSIKVMKKALAEYQGNVFVNETQGFQVAFRGTYLGCSKLQRQITVTAQKLLDFLTQPQQSSKEAAKVTTQDTKSKVTTQDTKRYTVASKCDSTEDSSKSDKQINNDGSAHTTTVSQMSQNTHLLPQMTGEGQEKRKTCERELKHKWEELQASCKRYVRTGSKRNIRSPSKLFSDENQGLSARTRGASPTYLVNLQ